MSAELIQRLRSVQASHDEILQAADRIADLERQNAVLVLELKEFRDEKQVLEIYRGIKSLNQADMELMTKWVAERAAMQAGKEPTK